jgi:hypothetical protein
VVAPVKEKLVKLTSFTNRTGGDGLRGRAAGAYGLPPAQNNAPTGLFALDNRANMNLYSINPNTVSSAARVNNRVNSEKGSRKWEGRRVEDIGATFVSARLAPGIVLNFH